jgi:hypothetical protein
VVTRLVRLAVLLAAVLDLLAPLAPAELAVGVLRAAAGREGARMQAALADVLRGGGFGFCQERGFEFSKLCLVELVGEEEGVEAAVEVGVQRAVGPWLEEIDQAFDKSFCRNSQAIPSM